MSLTARILALPPEDREAFVTSLWKTLATSEHGELLQDYFNGVVPGYLAVLMSDRAVDSQRSFYCGALAAVNDLKTRLSMAFRSTDDPGPSPEPALADLTSEDDDQPSDLYIDE